VSKLLATRLAPYLNQLVSRAQSAFIRKRSIHDNFLYTQNLIQELHRLKIPALFLKLDIAKAFDSVRWDYLMEVLEHMGFGAKWRGWISTLLSMAPTSVLLNRVRGNGSSMEPLQRLFDIATQEGTLTLFSQRSAELILSLFADDAAIFPKPVKEDVQETLQLLTSFGTASGLLTNIQKSAVYPICCDQLNMIEVMECFQCPVKFFPCTYLGLPLHTRKLRRVEVQPLVDKVSARLPAWKGKFLNRGGRLTVLNAVLSSIPTYFLTVFQLQK